MNSLAWYEGSEWELYLYSDRRFQKIFRDDMRFTVVFMINRLTIRIQHRAVELAGVRDFKKVLFPTGNSPTTNHTPAMELRSGDSYSNKSDFR